MKFTIMQNQLSEKISIVQRAVSSRVIIPELEGILIEAKEGLLSLTTTDSEIISIKTNIDCTIEEEGRALVNARILGDIIRRLPSEPVHISVEGQKMLIRCKNSKFDLLTMDPQEFPPLPRIERDQEITLSSSVLKNAIKQTSFAVSQDQNKRNLTGVLFELKDGQISFVSLDGYRLSVLREDLDTSGEFEAIIPGQALNELERILGDDQEENIKIFFSKNNVCFDMYDTVFFSQLIDGKFFNYEDIIRKDHATSISVNREDFQESLERASLLARQEKANLIKLSFSDSNCLIQSNTDLGSVEENIGCDIDGIDQVIAFNSRYLLEGIKNMRDETILIHLLDDVNPMIIVGEDSESYLYLVLPVRLA